MRFRELIELADGVYLFPRDDSPEVLQPNIGLVKGRQQTVLIDAGNSPRHARQIMAAMAGGGFPPIHTVIYTHHHWDHTFGASVYNADHIIAHHANHAQMLAYARQDWHEMAVRERIYENPRRETSLRALLHAIKDWDFFRVCLPNVTFESRMEIDLGHLTLQLHHQAGSRHAEDSIVVKVPQAGLMFLGDCYYPPPYHLREADDDDLHLPMLEQLAAEHYETYIDGHGNPRTLFEFQRMIDSEKARRHLTR